MATTIEISKNAGTKTKCATGIKTETTAIPKKMKNLFRANANRSLTVVSTSWPCS
jgi:hypothetical protein